MAAEMAVYEVFGQERKGDPHRHVGSLLAADSDMALLLAQELFCRRKEYVQIWVVPRDAVRQAPSDGATLGPEPRRTYRGGEGYRQTVEKWKRFGGDDRADRT
ncbi:MAG: phenylacetic acid degradation protein [Thermaerobacter sp.]|nr:phenylacetic acid degradation protein [Thermaerobacter sp.]